MNIINLNRFIKLIKINWKEQNNVMLYIKLTVSIVVPHMYYTIGQTKRKLKTKLHEHLVDIKKINQFSFYVFSLN